MIIAVVMPAWDLFHWSAFMGIAVPICTFFYFIYHQAKKNIFTPWEQRITNQHSENLKQNRELSNSINQLNKTLNRQYNEFDKRFSIADEIHADHQKHLNKHDKEILALQKDNYYVKKNIGLDDKGDE